MDKFLKNLESLLTTTPLPSVTAQSFMLAPIWEKLIVLKIVLFSSEYPCPICALHNKRGKDQGKITLSWDVEYDEYYPLSAMPVFEGTCGDEPVLFGQVRPRGRWSMSKMLPYNHAEQLNEGLDDSQISDEAAYILGAAQERRRIAELLGLKMKSWGDI